MFKLFSSKFLSYSCLRTYCNNKTSSNKFKNHYETLKLPTNCSYKDIRNSYLDLSKQYHPDKSNDKDSRKKFQDISEAYNVLSKPETRHNYDLLLFNPSYRYSKIRATSAGVWSDSTFWEYRDKSEDKFYESKPYYGIKGVKKVSNFVVVLLCIAFAATGVALQVFFIWKSFTLKRDDMNKRSLELEQLHSEIRKVALENGDEKQIRIFLEKVNFGKD